MGMATERGMENAELGEKELRDGAGPDMGDAGENGDGVDRED